MMMNHLLLPNSGWSALTGTLLTLRTQQNIVANGDDLQFLKQLGFVDGAGGLTDLGVELCDLMYVRRDETAANAIIHSSILETPATQALLQALAGLKDITVEQARMALVFAGLTEGDFDTKLTNFLMLLNANDIITYNRKNRSIKLLVSPKQSAAPSHVYIDRTRPYSNDLWIREILRECQGSIRWLDKYFQKEAFEWLWREASANRISRIQIVSTVSDEGVDAVALADYKRLKKELNSKGITIDWKVLKRKESHDLHDRWVIDDEGLCYNLPSINSIKSGQRSELHRSPNHAEIHAHFVEYFNKAAAV